jgi:small subunit ribosomal protein S1
MENQDTPDLSPTNEITSQPENDAEAFEALLSQFEKEHPKQAGSESGQKEGLVVSLTDELVILDIGLKIEGALPRADLKNNAEGVTPGTKILVSVKGRTEEGFYALSVTKVVQPIDWTALEKAFAEHTFVNGSVTGVVKGGLSVDVGVRAFMPASRSGTRDTSELERLVGQEVICKIVKLDAAEEDVVVDRRSVLEEQAREQGQRRYAEIHQGDVLTGQVRSLTPYGAFVDLGGVDGLLHISDMSWSRIASPEEILSAGQHLQVKVLKIDADKQRISLGLKQLQPEPWDSAQERYQVA